MQATDCPTAREAISAIVSGNFSDEDVCIVERHIEICSACAEDYNSLLQLVEILPAPDHDAQFNATADAAARRAVNVARHITIAPARIGTYRFGSAFSAAAMLAIGFGLGFATIKHVGNGNDLQMLTSQANNRITTDYIDFLERSHLLLLGAASCNPDCSAQDFELVSHQRRISIELLIEAQNIRKLPDVKLRPQELRLMENIESALTQVAAQGTTEKYGSIREESDAAVCEISRRLGM
ncbi:MAG: hypothetical protein LC116_06375 [Bacteroidetes bacterium]|nr:hypothetical protein [Bacteroidota bacterium]MCZ2132804.1 hypothetical protein [Bacteroidota bacterium]